MTLLVVFEVVSVGSGTALNNYIICSHVYLHLCTAMTSTTINVMYSVLQHIRSTVGAGNDNEFYYSPLFYLPELNTLSGEWQSLCIVFICCVSGYGHQVPLVVFPSDQVPLALSHTL